MRIFTVLACSFGMLACTSPQEETASNSSTSAGSGGNTGSSTSSAQTVGSSSQSTGSGTGGNTSTVTPIFRMDCEDAPIDCGWGYVPEPSPYYTMTHVEDGGPQGQDVVEFTHTPQAEGAPQVQYYNGWSNVGVEPPPAQGATRYIRFWFKPLTPIDWNGTGDVWTDKFIILGDGTAPTTRMICNLRDDYGIGGGANMLINCARNIDGEPSIAGGASMQPNEWSYIQIEVRSSSSETAEDARIAMWYDSNDYDAPTSQSSAGFVLETWGWANIGLGFYANSGLAHDGSVHYQLGGFEFDDEFDPNWSVP